MNYEWIADSVRRDKSFLHLAEQPIHYHLAEKLTELEQSHGEVLAVKIVKTDENFIEFIARVRKQNEI